MISGIFLKRLYGILAKLPLDCILGVVIMSHVGVGLNYM